MASSQDAYVWFGLTAASDGAACAAFFRSNEADAGRELWNLSVASNAGLRSTPMVGPFEAGASGIYCQLAGTRASALVALDVPAG